MNSMKYTMLTVLFSFSSFLAGMHNQDAQLSRSEAKDMLLVSLNEKNIHDVQQALDQGANPLDAAFYFVQLEEREFDAHLQKIVLVVQESIMQQRLEQEKLWTELCAKIGKFSDQTLAAHLFRKMDAHRQPRKITFGNKEEEPESDDEEITVQSSSFVNQPLVGFAVGFLGFFLLYLLFKHNDMPKTELAV